MRDRTILMGGFSKAYAMTGWRVGWLCAPAHLLEGIVKVHQYGIMSAPTMAQDAALRALTDGERDVRAMVAEYDRRRRLIVDGLNALGLPTFEPRGAFYAFPEVTTASDCWRRSASRSSRGARSARPARATCGPATRPRPRVWRRHSAGSAGSSSAPGCETRAMGAILGFCGLVAVIVGTWRGYAVARQAISPLVHGGDATRTAIEATRPLLDRPRVRLVFRRLAISIGWIVIALYGLFLALVGLELGA
jgi:hypothetical protein